jgi:hypothetical protein
MNTYEMFKLLRDMIAEDTAAHWSDDDLVRRLIHAQRKVALLVSQYPGQWLVKSASVTPSASVITLPTDCAKPMYLEETSSGQPLTFLEGAFSRRVSRAIGTSLDTGLTEVYPLRNTIEVNVADYSTACTLWYLMRVPDLIYGTAAAGGAASLTFPDSTYVRRENDYYNGVVIEAMEGTGAGSGEDTITDFVGSTRVATVTGTYDSDTVFGSISMLPEEAHSLILAEAVLSSMNKPSASIDEKIIAYYRDERNRERKELEEFLETRFYGMGQVVRTEDSI